MHSSFVQTWYVLCGQSTTGCLALAQDEGPVMITEAEEVTDQLRTQARTLFLFLCC